MGFWSRAPKSSASGTASSSSSSSTSSEGPCTPKFGAQTAAVSVREAGRGEIVGVEDGWRSHSDKDKDSTEDFALNDIELPAPPPLLLPLPLLSSGVETSSTPTPRQASPRSVGTIIADEDSSSGRTWTPESTLSRSPQQPKLLPSSTLAPPEQEEQSHPPTRPPRKRRGRSRSIHLLWRSRVDESAWQALLEFYKWSTGEEWPKLGEGSMEYWSWRADMAGL